MSKFTDEKTLNAETSQAVVIANGAALLNIESAEGAAQAQADLVEVKRRFKELNDWRTEVVEPLKEGIAKFEARVKPALAGWKNAETSLKQALIRWDQAERGRQLAAAVEAMKAAEQNAPAEVVRQLVIQSATPPVRTPGVSGVRSNWKARVMDLPVLMAAVMAGKTDAVYVVENQQALDAYAKATKGKGEIPGVEFYDAGSISVRV